LGYRDQLLNFIGNDGDFCNYLVKNNGSKTLDAYGNKPLLNNNNDNKDLYTNKNKREQLTKSIKNINEEDNFNNNNISQSRQKNLNESSYTLNKNQLKLDINNTFNDNNNNNFNIDTPNNKTFYNQNQNLMQINESKRHEEIEEKDKFQRRNSKLTNVFSNSYSKRFVNNNNYTSNVSEKEKRTILEHYRNLYSFKKKLNKNIEIENNNDNNNNGFFPNLTSNTNSFGNFQSEKSKKINSAEKNSMFRSSIYYNLLSKEPNTNLNSNTENSKIIKTEKNENKNLNKGNPSQTSYGPFLNINTNYQKEIVIENPAIKRSLEDINYYGPYFSHCPICRNRNLDFYQTMEPHQCLKLLNYIKKKRSNIQVK
jgi:hypothetical protein